LPMSIQATATRIEEMKLAYGMKLRIYPIPPSHL
jgi:hypothetical protein